MKKTITLNSRILAIIAGSLLIVTFVLLIISNIIPSWRSRDSGILSLRIGIWKSCITLLNSKTCFAIPCDKNNGPINDCVKMYIGRILFIGSCVITAISALCLFLIALQTKKRNQSLFLIIKILVFISLLMGIIVISITLYSTRISQIEMPLGTSAYLGITAIVTHLVGASLTVLI